MGITLYQRLTLNEASLFLHYPESDVRQLLWQGKIEHIRVTDEQAEFFGYQLLGTYSAMSRARFYHLYRSRRESEYC